MKLSLIIQLMPLLKAVRSGNFITTCAMSSSGKMHDLIILSLEYYSQTSKLWNCKHFKQTNKFDEMSFFYFPGDAFILNFQTKVLKNC